MWFCDGGKRYGFSGRRLRIPLKKKKRKEIYNIIYAPWRVLGVAACGAFRGCVLRVLLVLPGGSFLFCVCFSSGRGFAAGLPRLRGAGGQQENHVCLLVLSAGPCSASASRSALVPSGGAVAGRRCSIFPWAVCRYHPSKRSGSFSLLPVLPPGVLRVSAFQIMRACIHINKKKLAPKKPWGITPRPAQPARHQ